MKKLLLSLLFVVSGTSVLLAQNFSHMAGSDLRVQTQQPLPPVARTALELLGRDVRQTLGDTIVEVTEGGEILLNIKREERPEYLLSKPQAFALSVEKGQLVITGSDAHGLAYGIMEVSRLLGVSPWKWWADVVPQRKGSLIVNADYINLQAPSVEYRGIFINDEDWGILPWSSQTYEPEHGKGVMGPRTHARIFELMLRLRANLFWPAMHEGTEPFYLTPGNREMARKYGIYLGGSHCEPMATSPAGEWQRMGRGDYDYINNKDGVRRYWQKRLREVKDQPIVYTLGMRGVHDGKMRGVKTLDEQRGTLQQVIEDQRRYLSTIVDSDLTKIPQVFIPYKEVLDVYNSGLMVPDDVCMMWCDDNYGYIRHFPTEKERSRRGGNGLYYHISYWGRPHDYLWLGTFSPKLMTMQLRTAWDRGIRRMWVLNVGDIKPAEYQIELFCDMAWNVEQVSAMGEQEHLVRFCMREFGPYIGQELAPLLKQSYDLAFVCKPEFLGHTRTEEKDPKYQIVNDLPWTERYIRHRLKDYAELSQTIKVMAQSVPADRMDAFYQLAQYPIQAADQMNRKMLIGQLCRHGRAKWTRSDAAHDSIVALTRKYNEGFHNNGKWQGMMDMSPRELPVFQPLQHRTDNHPMLRDDDVVMQWQAPDLWVELTEGREMTFPAFECPSADSLCFEIYLLPTHPLDNKNLRFEVSYDGRQSQTFSIRTEGRSEEWKQNVLTNKSLKRWTVPCSHKKKHKLTIKPLDKGLFLEELIIKKVK